jgi:thiol-disulfide isomerase/thioredoxin
MTTQESVVTPARFSQGMSWEAYVEYIGSEENLQRPGPRGERPNNSERYQRNIDEYTMKPEHETALKALPTMKLLVIGEDWCPDVFRGMPVLARIAEAAGWEARFFQRDQNNDIMDEFLNVQNGQSFQSIPVAVVYTEDMQYVGHFIERPVTANEYRASVADQFKQRDGETQEDVTKRMRKFYGDLQKTDEWDRWRHATVDEIIEIAKKAG